MPPFPSDTWTFTPVGTEERLAYIEVEGVRIYDARHLFSDAFGEGSVEKTGYAVHHDAVAMHPGSLQDDLARIEAIHRHHTVTNGWGGIGYHRIISPSARVFLVGSSASQRAHVAGLNHLWIGYCFMGDYSNQRPPEAAMHAFRTALQWETDRRGVPMSIAPHKRLNAGTVCPGAWAEVDAWSSLTLQPAAPAPPPPVDHYARGFQDGRADRLREIKEYIEAL